MFTCPPPLSFHVPPRTSLPPALPSAPPSMAAPSSSLRDFEMLDRLGQGSFGAVYRVCFLVCASALSRRLGVSSTTTKKSLTSFVVRLLRAPPQTSPPLSSPGSTRREREDLRDEEDRHCRDVLRRTARRRPRGASPSLVAFLPLSSPSRRASTRHTSPPSHPLYRFRRKSWRGCGVRSW